MSYLTNVYNKKEREEFLIKANKAKELYLTKKYSLTKLAKMLNSERHHLSRFFKENNISVINRQNECKFNNHVFDKIDTEEKAYWLGFIYADGYVSSRDNTFEVSLQLEDLNHLKKLKDFLNWKGNIKTDSYRCRLYICDKYFKSVLINKGCIPNKSLVLTFPNNRIIKNEYLYHFIRGYFDGDGCIYIPKVKQKRCCISLLGTHWFLNTLLKRTNWVQNKLVSNNHSIITFSLGYGGKKALFYLNQLYKNSTIYLDRKYKKYKQLAVLYGNI